MLIGAHVSPAGGLPKAIERGVEKGCRAIQIFNQSPRAWRLTDYGEERLERERRKGADPFDPSGGQDRAKDAVGDPMPSDVRSSCDQLPFMVSQIP